jgi:hypothetical protein
MIAAVPTAVESAACDHGDTDSNPNPAPKARRVSDNAAATNAPAITAPQDTPDDWASRFAVASL